MDEINGLNNILNLFFSVIRSKNKTLVNNLNSGLSDEEINEAFKNIGIEPPSAIKALFKIKNGIKSNSKLNVSQKLLFPNGIFMPMNDCVEEFKSLMYNELLRNRFPIFDSGAGDFLMYDFGENSRTRNRIMIYSPALLLIEPVTIYDSLYQMLISTIRCFAEGIYYFDSQKNLQYDLLRRNHIMGQLNPDSQFWRIS